MAQGSWLMPQGLRPMAHGQEKWRANFPKNRNAKFQTSKIKVSEFPSFWKSQSFKHMNSKVSSRLIDDE